MTLKKQSRIFGFDAARSAMMILGIVLHSLIFSIFYAKIDSLAEAQIVFGVFFTIHAFRMPAFFFLAGYFAGLLISKRGLNGYLKNRLMRVGAVFIFIAPVRVLLTNWASGGLDTNNQSSGINLHHLWFLYFLLIISVLTYFLSLIQLPETFISIQKIVGLWITDPRLLWILPFILSLIPGILDESARIRTSEGLIPDFKLLLLYVLFFSLGKFFYHTENLGLQSLSRRTYPLCIIGFMCAQISFGWGADSISRNVKIFLSFMASFYLALGVIALFVRFVKEEHPIWIYLTGASYWIYLVHLPIVFGFLRFFSSQGISGLFLATLTFFATTALSICSYEVIVRRSFLSKFVG